ncbi:uncharacterized protein K441DRAFT_671229 [Cenococcum geophilum 1.58]|uniref:Uncharacterized protein n=1 Tax=Cenococcum geophilum 1.58 TaxID=794803 RepID=A0ACC8ELB4_9PEZI|nr:hypothetical protein K441DRAFT_671229 [Cenococcum geophilum 1.58]
MDPLSIVALTIKVLDQLWKIGDRTATLISNFRDFDSDTRVLENKICDENNRTRALHMLLFDPSTIYGGKSLFEQFDTDVQDQIHIFLEQASDVLDQAYQLLNRRQDVYPKGREPKRAATPTLLVSISPSPSSASLTPNDATVRRLKSFQRLRWSLLDKRRVETIVRDFSELNSRIHESIKLWCLGTSIGVNLQHLKRLETDVNSQALGFDVDARLQIATSQSLAIVQSLEINDAELRQKIGDVKQVVDKFGVLHWESKPVLVEYRSYSPESPVPVELDDRTRDLVDKLANLLRQPKEVVFRTPCCRGWVRQMQQNRVAYIFAIPEAVDPWPISLLNILSSNDLPPPSLSQRFWLAVKLSRCISQLQLVKWVHESFRSENILFFPKAETREPPTPPDNRLDLSEPWVLGFEFSRPEMYFSHGHADTCLTRDIYRHPDRQRNPTQIFSKVHDIYALGVVLLEIGLWQPALSLEKSGFTKVQYPHAIKKHLVRHAEKRLGAKMGDKYQNVVLKCLRGNFEVTDDTKEDLKLQQAFRAQIVDVLQKAADSV